VTLSLPAMSDDAPPTVRMLHHPDTHPRGGTTTVRQDQIATPPHIRVWCYKLHATEQSEWSYGVTLHGEPYQGGFADTERQARAALRHTLRYDFGFTARAATRALRGLR
jgi:hypothetical protein